MKLKLRGNANALTRSSQLAVTTLDAQRRDAMPRHETNEAPQQDQVLASLDTVRAELRQTPKQPEPATAEPPNDLQRDRAWANAMTNVAAEYSAELEQLPPHQRQTHLIRIGALTQAARALNRGTVPLKSRLLGSTSLHAGTSPHR